jgi:hypothetical protein
MRAAALPKGSAHGDDSAEKIEVLPLQYSPDGRLIEVLDHVTLNRKESKCFDDPQTRLLRTSFYAALVLSHVDRSGDWRCARATSAARTDVVPARSY